MASCGFAFLLSIVLISEAKSQLFVSVDCQKSEMIAQYGTNTLLDCVVQTKEHDPKILVVIWRLNKSTVLQIHEGVFKQKTPRFEYAVSSWDASNLNVSLLITNTDLSHAGDYTCEVVLDVGGGETKMHLTVEANYSKPEIRSEPEKIIPDKSFNLTCATHGGYPKGDIRWVVDGDAWRKNPQVQVKKNPNGLYDLTSTLSFGPDLPFKHFECEVYNAKGVKEDKQEWAKLNSEHVKDNRGPSNSHIVAPAVVIGSLIVGLLAAVLLCRKRRQKARRLSTVPLMNVTPNEPEENNAMV